MSELVQYKVIDRIGYLTLNRPEKRNALGFEFVKQIKEKFLAAESDANCRLIVVEANGEAFCAGADLAYIQQLQNFSEEENLIDSKNLMELFQMIYSSAKVVISKVNGAALAGGCGLATVCDFCIATPSSTFGYTEARIGFVPAMVMVFLLRKVNGSVARGILLSADIFKAEDALRYQLINKIIPESEINEYVHQFATRLTNSTSLQSVSLIKKMMVEIPQLTLQEGLEYAAIQNVKARQTMDCKKGIAAFLAKEKIIW